MAQGLKRCDFRFQRLDAATSEIVPGDIDAGDQSPLRQRCHLVEGRIADDEVPAELVCRGSLRMKHVVLPPFEAEMRREHR